jgi:serine/threonine-protein phosphatase 2B regulatory subunit
MFDENGSGAVDFSEFCGAVMQFSTKSQNDKLRFAFWCLDLDDSGELDRDEMKGMLLSFQLASGEKMADHKVNLIFSQIDVSRNGKIGFEEFKAFATAFPSLIFPVYSLFMRAADLANVSV